MPAFAFRDNYPVSYSLAICAGATALALQAPIFYALDLRHELHKWRKQRQILPDRDKDLKADASKDEESPTSAAVEPMSDP